MKKNKLGRTNLEISEITLGGGWVGGLFIDAEYKVMEKAIELALDNGINWIDTAESYSEGVSEKNIGILLDSLNQNEKLYVSSKARLDPQSSETFESQIDRKLDNSLKRLKLDQLNLYQLHNKITHEKNSGTLTEKEILEKNGVAEIYSVTNVINLEEEERRAHMVSDLIGEKYGNRAQYALRYGLSSKNIHSIIVGMATLEHLKNSIEAVEMGPLPASLLEDISELQKSNFF